MSQKDTMSADISLDVKGYSDIEFTQEMKDSYSAYIRMVVQDRSLPDVRDGLKPVQRRILFAMKEGSYTFSNPHRKCARIVGDMMGKYHPHGDTAIYDALVRMGQEFVMRLPFIDGQGNFGSIDGDNPAAMRYTEARTILAAEDLLGEIDAASIRSLIEKEETKKYSSKMRLTPGQAQEILNMRLQRLTGLEQQTLEKEGGEKIDIIIKNRLLIEEVRTTEFLWQRAHKVSYGKFKNKDSKNKIRQEGARKHAHKRMSSQGN